MVIGEAATRGGRARRHGAQRQGVMETSLHCSERSVSRARHHRYLSLPATPPVHVPARRLVVLSRPQVVERHRTDRLLSAAATTHDMPRSLPSRNECSISQPATPLNRGPLWSTQDDTPPWGSSRTTTDQHPPPSSCSFLTAQYGCLCRGGEDYSLP